MLLEVSDGRIKPPLVPMVEHHPVEKPGSMVIKGVSAARQPEVNAGPATC